jgi:uncharacterized protein YecT (DUF1311 family)
MTQLQRPLSLTAAVSTILVIGMAGQAMAEGESAKCFEQAKSQNETNQCAGQDVGAADAELNAVYQRLQSLYADEPEFLAKLKTAQRAWIAFRDAELEARFPANDKAVNYGSMFPTCAGAVLADLTRKRTAQLTVWVDGVPEGDVCGGSIRLKETGGD